MKHNLKITVILLTMFVITQLIGLYVVGYYSPVKIVEGNVTNVTAPDLPFGLETPEIQQESDYYGIFTGIIIAFIIAISLFLIMTKFRIELIIKIWFLVVVILALSISFLSILSPLVSYSLLITLVLAVPLALVKIYGRNFLVHNFTELFIYPGIAAVFVPLLNVFTVVALLVLISAYDIWAVWHSKIMIKMAKYQIDHLKIFSGFFVPYTSNKVRKQIKKWKKTLSKKQLSKKKIKINLGILGGGDVVFPIIAAGVMLKTLGFGSALFVVIGATLGLTYLFFFAKKKKYYPAMPFITTGILLGILASYLIL